MAKRPPREIQRSTQLRGETVGSPPLVRRRQPGQPDLFATDFIEPCKPILSKTVPVGSDWIYEIKHDGYRSQLHANGGHARIFTRRGHDWSARMPAIRQAIEALPVDSAVIDAETVMVDGAGVSDFFALHKALANRSAPQAFVYAFDLLHLNGEDLRRRPLSERRGRLEELLTFVGPAIQFSDHMTGDGAEILAHACKMGLEGIVAKDATSRYRSGNDPSWVKVKCTEIGMFGVTGYDPEGRRDVAALHLAELVGGKLRSVGSVGSGLSSKTSPAIRARLDAGDQVVVEVEFRGRTPSGNLRHPALKRVL